MTGIYQKPFSNLIGATGESGHRKNPYSVILHACFLEFPFTEKQFILTDTYGFSHLLSQFDTLVPAGSVDHGVKVVMPVIMGSSLIAVADLGKFRQDPACLLYSGTYQATMTLALNPASW